MVQGAAVTPKSWQGKSGGGGAASEQTACWCCTEGEARDMPRRELTAMAATVVVRHARTQCPRAAWMLLDLQRGAKRILMAWLADDGGSTKSSPPPRFLVQALTHTPFHHLAEPQASAAASVASRATAGLKPRGQAPANVGFGPNKGTEPLEGRFRRHDLAIVFGSSKEVAPQSKEVAPHSTLAPPAVTFCWPNSTRSTSLVKRSSYSTGTAVCGTVAATSSYY